MLVISFCGIQYWYVYLNKIFVLFTPSLAAFDILL